MFCTSVHITVFICCLEYRYNKGILISQRYIQGSVVMIAFTSDDDNSGPILLETMNSPSTI